MIGFRLKELRNQHKYTIAQVCEMLSLNPNTYAKYERDERDVSTETLAKLADFYGVTTDYLLGRDKGEPSPLDELAGQFNMSLLEKKIVENYLALPEKMRGDLMEFMQKSVKEVAAESPVRWKVASSSDDHGSEVTELTAEEQQRLDNAADETKNSDNDL